jgi:DNA-binding NarL/FixJ family response regulator
MRTGVKSIVHELNGFEIVHEALDERDLFSYLDNYPFDIVIIDYHQGDDFSLRTLQRIKREHPSKSILVVSNDKNRYRILGTIEQGVNNFVTKNCGEDEIRDAIIATGKQEKFFCGTVLDYIVQRDEGEVSDCSPAVLSERELEIVELVAQGMISKQIASKLHLSPHTVNTHRKNILKKLELNSSSELILYAFENGIIESPNNN